MKWEAFDHTNDLKPPTNLKPKKKKNNVNQKYCRND